MKTFNKSVKGGEKERMTNIVKHGAAQTCQGNLQTNTVLQEGGSGGKNVKE